MALPVFPGFRAECGANQGAARMSGNPCLPNHLPSGPVRQPLPIRLSAVARLGRVTSLARDRASFPFRIIYIEEAFPCQTTIPPTP